MAELVKNTSEVERKFPRYKIPLTLAFDEYDYEIREFSLKGFSVFGLINPSVNIPFKSAIKFQSNKLEINLNIEIKPVWYDKNENITGCKFYNQNKSQQFVFQQIIDTFTSRKILSATKFLDTSGDSLTKFTKLKNDYIERKTSSQQVAWYLLED